MRIFTLAAIGINGCYHKVVGTRRKAGERMTSSGAVIDSDAVSVSVLALRRTVVYLVTCDLR